MAFECMNDCIHLKACRRMQAIGRKHRLLVPRYCTQDCTAYISRESGNYITVDEAVEYARNGADSIRNGYDSYDVYAATDLNGQSVGDIIDDIMEKGEINHA